MGRIVQQAARRSGRFLSDQGKPLRGFDPGCIGARGIEVVPGRIAGADRR